jgi:hypothetical protein
MTERSDRVCVALSACLACVLACGALVGQGPLTNGDIVKMVQAGVGNAVVVKAIETAPATAFDTSPDGLIALKTAGVPDAVLTAMIGRARAGGAGAVRGAGAGSSRGVVAETPVEIPDGTDIRLRLVTAASSASAETGDAIRFSVMDAVKVGTVTVIEKGAIATGRISEVKKGGILGRAGSLHFSIESVPAIDGTSIKLRFSREVKGAGRMVNAVTAAATGATARRSPQSIGSTGARVLSKGGEVTIRAGTEYGAFTNGAHMVTGRALTR